MEQIVINAAKGLIIWEGRGLILRRSPYDKTFAGTWELPGGKLEFGEGLEECLCREIREETGLEAIEIKRLLYANTFLTHPWRQVVVVTYLCQTREEKICLSREHTEYRWATGDEIKAMLPQPIVAEMSQKGVFDLLGQVL